MVHGYHASYTELALGKLNRIIFPFFWKGKKDLVARAVVIHSRSSGGLGIDATHLKSQALLVQWIKRFWATYGWRLFLVYWTQFVFRASPGEVLTPPFSFNLKRLRPFYATLFDAWRAVDGHAFPPFYRRPHCSNPGFTYYL